MVYYRGFSAVSKNQKDRFQNSCRSCVQPVACCLFVSLVSGTRLPPSKPRRIKTVYIYGHRIWAISDAFRRPGRWCGDAGSGKEFCLAGARIISPSARPYFSRQFQKLYVLICRLTARQEVSKMDVLGVNRNNEPGAGSLKKRLDNQVLLFGRCACDNARRTAHQNFRHGVSRLLRSFRGVPKGKRASLSQRI